MSKTNNVGILIFNGVELLDFCGPFEVFSVTRLPNGESPFHVFTLAESRPIVTRNGLSVNPKYTLPESPGIEVLIIPGGQGTRTEICNCKLIDWIRGQATQTELLLSVCTGALLLAEAGLLNGLDVTTHHNATDLLEKLAPASRLMEKARFVDNGRIILSGGIAAGIDMSLYVVAKLLGQEVAQATAELMEYSWNPEYMEPLISA